MLLLKADGEVIPVNPSFKELILAGWSGRDKDKVMEHVKELEEIGVPPPEEVPQFFRVGTHLLTHSKSITHLGGRNNGEVEYVLFVRGGRPLYLTVGSDHTCRDLERRSVPLSKWVYPKVIPPALWLYEEVRDHWDELVLRMYVDGVLAQESDLSYLLRPEDLTSKLGYDEYVLFSGSIPWISGLKFGEEYRIEIEDPVLGRKISYKYMVRT